MRTLHLHTSKPYPVFIGAEEVLDVLPSLLAVSGNAAFSKVALMCDEQVRDLYAASLENFLHEKGFHTVLFSFPQGEEHKNAATYLDALQFLECNGFTRHDTLIALGGGVTGDLAGFVAATYMRGMGFVQMPTTLLACIDASVGGKNAINLPRGKNRVGTFYSPKAVVMDTSKLVSLDPMQWQNGFGEGLKYAVLLGGPLLDSMEQGITPVTSPSIIEEFIVRCISCKGAIVEKDERDYGQRHLLNLGHTLGHAMEQLSGYRLPHGICVANGMALVAKASYRRGLLKEADYRRIINLTEKYGMPTDWPFPKKDIFEVVKRDKKVEGDSLAWIMIYGIGDCRIAPIAMDRMEEWFE